MSDERPQPKFLSVGNRTVRLDTARGPSTNNESTKTGLLDLFRSWLRRDPQDRRIMPRHPAYELKIWIGWCRDEQSFFASFARLVNISRGGALIVVPDPPPQGELAWICLGEPEPKDCIEGRVLEVTPERSGEHSVRLAFTAPCPHEFFEAAVCMLPTPPNKEKKPSAPESE